MKNGSEQVSAKHFEFWRVVGVSIEGASVGVAMASLSGHPAPYLAYRLQGPFPMASRCATRRDAAAIFHSLLTVPVFPRKDRLPSLFLTLSHPH